MRQERNAYSTLAGKPKRTRLVLRPVKDNNIKMQLRM
jgi:hypothetical protein